MTIGGHDTDAPEEDAECARLAALAGLAIMDTPPEQAFDTIVEAAQRALRCKIALLSLVDDHRQWFKAKRGLAACETPRGDAFCVHAIAANDMLIVPDACADARFAANPLVLGPPHIRFYAGMPVRVHAGGADDPGLPMGTLCVIDDAPRTFDADEVQILRSLAHLAESLLDARAAAAAAIRLAEDRRTVLRALDLKQRQFGQAERMANIGSWRLTLADQRTDWSDQVYAIHGLPTGQQPSVDQALDFFPPHARATIAAALTRAIEVGEGFDIQADFVTARGDRRRVRSMGELEVRDGQPVAVIGVLQDITSQHAMEQALRSTAYMDDLTRLANRSRFTERVEEEIAAARAQQAPMALLLIDLDNFKTVNDRCGHLAGDDVLRGVAACLQAPYLADCTAARLGGDEFVLLVTASQDLADLPGLIRQLLADLRQSVSHAGFTVAVSGTIGACWLSDDVRDRSDLLHRADLALYKAKRMRRGTAMIYGQDLLIEPAEPAPVASRRVAR